MRTWEWSPFMVLCIATTLACTRGGNRPPEAEKQGARALLATDSPRSALDSTALVRFLASRGYALMKVAAHRDQYYAVIAEWRANRIGHLLVIRADGDSFNLIPQPGEATEIGPSVPDRIEWVSLRGGPIDALLVTYDQPLEGITGTLVLSVSPKGLVRVYGDPEDSCKPAELRDLNGDGLLELISYVEDPSTGDCGEQCHLAISERFGIGPAWVQVQRWSGSEWLIASDEHRAFYGDLAVRYQRVHDWLLQGAAAGECQNVYWLRDKAVFRRWASRANAIAASNK